MNDLTALANKYHSDKGTSYSFAHRYTHLYDLIFRPFRNQPINFLELGLAVGGPETATGKIERSVNSPSVQMWLEYFPAATIFGFDISDFSHMKNERFRFLRGDSGVVTDLLRLSAAASHFDIVIDDASHASYHQQLAFKVLWNSLSPGGLYVLEDLHWQSPVFEQSLPKVPLTREFFTSWFERKIYMENCVISSDDMSRISSEVEIFAPFPAFNTGNNASFRLFDGSAKIIVFGKRG